jgi:hypothetical protein
MTDLSQARTLARPSDLGDNKLDALIYSATGAKRSRASRPPLGWTFDHASGLAPCVQRTRRWEGLARREQSLRSFRRPGSGLNADGCTVIGG